MKILLEVYLTTGTSSRLFKLVKQWQQQGKATYGNTSLNNKDILFWMRTGSKPLLSIILISDVASPLKWKAIECLIGKSWINFVQWWKHVLFAFKLMSKECFYLHFLRLTTYGIPLYLWINNFCQFSSQHLEVQSEGSMEV